MAYVVPSGTIQLFRSVNLDNRYMHTIYFADTNAQNRWFTNKIAYTFTAQNYTRHNENVVKLKIDCDTIADCTYMRFQNRTNGKWYYCFITGVNYVNNNTTAVTFEIDVMQTWFFQTGHVIKPCFVDREHVNSDTFGIYHAPDTPRTDEYVFNWIKDSDKFGNYTMMVMTSNAPSPGFMYDNDSYAGCHVFRMSANSEDDCRAASALIETALGGSWDKNEQSANMIDMYMFPSAFDSTNIMNNVHTVGLSRPTSFSYSDGNYTPKNNRLLANPYCTLLVTDFNGNNCMYEWELFSNPSSLEFTLRGNPLGGGSIIVYPRSYAGLTSNFDAGFLMNDFPKRPYSYDAYSAWVAGGGLTRMKNASDLVGLQGIARISETAADAFKVVASGTKAGLAVGAAVATGGAATPLAVIGAANTTADIASATANGINRYVAQKEAENKIVYEFNDAKYAPDIVFGSLSPEIAVSHKILEVNFIAMYPKKDEAIRIDDFFSTYGYSIKEVKTPNITGRKHWNFLKTKGAVIGGNMPTSSRQAIADIIDGGIFFWKNGDELGNFKVEMTNGSINNPII